MIKTKTKKETVWGHAIKCSRFQCNCEKMFNFYESKKKNWTIPKIKLEWSEYY